MSTADALPIRPQAIRQNIGRIFTPWFTLLVTVALLLVIVEGLTRGNAIVYGETDDTQFISFGPYFAWITLPLILAYAKSIRVRVSEALLLWLVLGSVTYDKSFAYTRIPGIPVYVTDIVLLVCCLDLWKQDGLSFRSFSKWQWIFFGLFFGAGCLAAARGFLGAQDKEKTVRDFAIVLYTVFALVAASLFHSWVSIKRYLVFAALGAILSTVNAFMWFTTIPDLRRYIPVPVYVQVAFVSLVLLKIRGWKGWRCNLLIAFSALGLLLADARSSYLFSTLTVIVILAISVLVWKRISWAVIRAVSITLLTTILLVTLAVQTEAGSRFMKRSEEQITSGINYSDDPNAIFRFMAWAEAYRRFAENPTIGEGYGIPFVFALADDDPRPHNTYLTVLYKMGIVGFLPFVAILAQYYIRSLTSLYRYRNLSHSTWLFLLITIQFSFCAYGALNLLLESPFTASLFWINLGMTVSALLLLHRESCALDPQNTCTS